MLYSLVLYVSMLSSHSQWLEQRIDIQDNMQLSECTKLVESFNSNLDNNLYFYCEPTFKE